MEKTEFDLYKDIQSRTNGDIYIGVVGPVRTGKSTFINQFMEKCVIAAVVDNGAIGKDSYLLWHIPWRTSFPGD